SRGAAGLNWSTGTIGSLDFYGVAAVGPLLVAVGQQGARAESSDGVSWSLSDSGTVNDLYGVRAVDGGLFAFGRFGTVLKSSCGTTAQAISLSGGRPPVRLPPR